MIDVDPTLTGLKIERPAGGGIRLTREIDLERLESLEAELAARFGASAARLALQELKQSRIGSGPWRVE